MLSNRIQRVKPSATLAINAKAIELQKQGIDILKFGTGEPDCDTPEHIKDAAKKALDQGFTKYTATGGIPELKKAVCEKFKRDNGIDYEPGQVLVSNGGKQAIFNCLMALINPGDEVIIPSPYWVSYADMVNVCEGEPVFVDTTANRFKCTAAMVEKAITPKTKLVFLNSPSNPTGAVIEKEEIIKIGELALKHKFYVLSDEVYEYFTYNGQKSFSLASIPAMKDWVFTVNATSKTYSMTGWRIGYVAGPKAVIKAMDDLQGHSTSNPCSIAQKAALAALTGPQDCVTKMVEEFRKRRDYIYEVFKSIPGVKLDKPEGAFYIFPDVSAYYKGAITDSFKMAEYLLEKARVAVVPGGAFGKEGDKCIRMSYASSMKDIEEGIKRIKAALA